MPGPASNAPCITYHLTLQLSFLVCTQHCYFIDNVRKRLSFLAHMQGQTLHTMFTNLLQNEPKFSDENSSHVHAQNFLQKTYSEIVILLKIFASILVPDINGNIFKTLSLKGWENCVLNPRKDFSSACAPVRPGQMVTVTMPLHRGAQ